MRGLSTKFPSPDIASLAGKRVALWGWGREGRAAYAALRATREQGTGNRERGTVVRDIRFSPCFAEHLYPYPTVPCSLFPVPAVGWMAELPEDHVAVGYDAVLLRRLLRG